jgi:type II secretory pathway component HofQ
VNSKKCRSRETRAASASRFILSFFLVVYAPCASAQSSSNFDTLIQEGNTQLQAKRADQALAFGEAAIKISAKRWDGYALAGGALMNLERYEEAVDTLSKAIERAPESKQATLRELRRQCLLAESRSPAVASTPAPATTTSQAEIVLWKSIENSRNGADFQTYLEEYPQGAFAALARRHLADAPAQSEQDKQSSAANAAAGAGQPEALTECAIRTIEFRRGDDGTARVIVQLTDSHNPINVRREGNQIVVDFAGTAMPKNLMRRYDVTDFATPVQTIDAIRVRGDSRLVITAKGDFEQLAHRADDRYIIEIKPSPKRTAADDGHL